jgi:hypothetical protein
MRGEEIPRVFSPPTDRALTYMKVSVQRTSVMWISDGGMGNVMPRMVPTVVHFASTVA